MSAKKSLYIAHRGHGFYENTEQSYKNSKKYYGIEGDVRVTADGRFIMNHDPAVKFEDGSVFEVEKSTYKELMDKTLIGGYKLCSFETYLQTCKELNKQAIIELKTLLTETQISELIAKIDKYHTQQKSTIISFKKENVIAFKNITNMPVMLLFDLHKESNIEFCIQNKITPSIYYPLIRADDIKKIHASGLQVGTWTVNNIFANIRMKKLKLDFITSDKYYL